MGIASFQGRLAPGFKGRNVSIPNSHGVSIGFIGKMEGRAGFIPLGNLSILFSKGRCRLFRKETAFFSVLSDCATH